MNGTHSPCASEWDFSRASREIYLGRWGLLNGRSVVNSPVCVKDGSRARSTSAASDLACFEKTSETASCVNLGVRDFGGVANNPVSILGRGD